MQNKILLAERILLQTLGFDLQLIHPYRACLDKIKDSLRCKNFCINSYHMYFIFFEYFSMNLSFIYPFIYSLRYSL